jgi:hypothetical protein
VVCARACVGCEWCVHVLVQGVHVLGSSVWPCCCNQQCVACGVQGCAVCGVLCVVCKGVLCVVCKGVLCVVCLQGCAVCAWARVARGWRAGARVAGMCSRVLWAIAPGGPGSLEVSGDVWAASVGLSCM